MRGRYGALLALGSLAWLAGSEAQEARDESLPDLDLLEYLGAWAAEDDEWFVIEEWRKDNPDEGQDADEDTEQDDEDEDRE